MFFLHICSVMLERLLSDGQQFEAKTKEHIKRYAEAGLRTLVVAYRQLGDDEYRIWEKEFSEAKAAVTADKDVLVDEIASKIEKDLHLLGATAVEDKLQKGVGSGLGQIFQFQTWRGVMFNVIA